MHDYLCQKLWWAKNGLFAWSLTKLWDLQLSNAIMSQSYFTSIPFWCTFKPYQPWVVAFWDLNFDVVWHFLRVHYDYYQKKNVVVGVNPSHFLRLVRLAKMLEIFLFKRTCSIYICWRRNWSWKTKKKKRERYVNSFENVH